MRRDSKVNPGQAKRVARQMYGERQIDKWCKWSWELKVKLNIKN